MTYTIAHFFDVYCLWSASCTILTLSLDAARWHMVKDATSHGYTWFVVRYV